MSVSLSKTKSEMLQELVEQYRSDEHGGPLDLDEVASWLLRKKLWEVGRSSATRTLRRELAWALRHEHITDPQGRRVRKNHAYRITKGERQLVFWVDMLEATADQMRRSLQQRRLGILDDCKQLKNDADSFNDNNVHGAHIQMTFDFTEDLLEAEMPSTYPESKPEEG